MIWMPVIGVVTAAATGHLVLRILSPVPVSASLRTVRAAMALLIGIALHSLWQFAWVALDVRSGSPARLLVYDTALPALALAAFVATRRAQPDAGSSIAVGDAGIPARDRSRRMWLPGLALVACATALVFAAKLAALQPDGEWDAWAIWNFKARWLALGGTPWSEILTNPVLATSHPDYPLLLPLSIARLWRMTGGVPMVVAQTFAVGTGTLVGVLLVGAVWCLRGPTAAAVAGAGLLVLPGFVRASASQLADVPLAACYLATLVALALGARGERGRWFALAGLSAGAAMWTKNEGVLFFGCVLVALLIAAAGCGRQRRETRHRVAAFVAGAAPFAAAVLVLKFIAIDNDLVAGQSVAATWQRVTTLARYGQIVCHATTLLTTMPDPIGVILFAGYLGFRGRAADMRPALPIVGALALTACGYFAMYVVTPNELSWHLDTSADRLLIQLWPSALFAALLLARDEPVIALAAEPAYSRGR
jgi:hypothetical protein